MPVLTDTLETWMRGFEALYEAAGDVDANLPNQTLNWFANATIATVLPNAGNVVDFSTYAKIAFANAGLKGWKIPQPIDTTRTFANLMQFPLWHSLSYSATLYVQAFVSPTSIDQYNSLIPNTPLTAAFPNGPTNANWAKLLAGLVSMKFDQVLAAGAFATAGQQIAPGSGALLGDLIATLSTI